MGITDDQHYTEAISHLQAALKHMEYIDTFGLFGDAVVRNQGVRFAIRSLVHDRRERALGGSEYTKTED